MHLGAFSVSLSVKDLSASADFYETLGFERMGGDGEHYLILKSGDTVLGLFQGMFEGNVLTFNPGWTQQAEALDSFDDVREIRARLLDAGITLTQDTDPEGDGPGHIAFVDPDGNAILIDQHVPRAGGGEG